MHNQFKTQKFKHLMLAMGPRDLNSAPYSPVHCSSHSMTSFQSSELTKLPVVENSQLFRTARTQRVHSARYAPFAPHRLQGILHGSGTNCTEEVDKGYYMHTQFWGACMITIHPPCGLTDDIIQYNDEIYKQPLFCTPNPPCIKSRSTTARELARDP